MTDSSLLQLPSDPVENRCRVIAAPTDERLRSEPRQDSHSRLPWSCLLNNNPNLITVPPLMGTGTAEFHRNEHRSVIVDPGGSRTEAANVFTNLQIVIDGVGTVSIGYEVGGQHSLLGSSQGRREVGRKGASDALGQRRRSQTCAPMCLI
jgi:hypothetical protein